MTFIWAVTYISSNISYNEHETGPLREWGDQGGRPCATVSRNRNVILDERRSWHMTSMAVSSDFRKTNYRRPNTNLRNLPIVIATKTLISYNC